MLDRPWPRSLFEDQVAQEHVRLHVCRVQADDLFQQAERVRRLAVQFDSQVGQLVQNRRVTPVVRRRSFQHRAGLGGHRTLAIDHSQAEVDGRVCRVVLDGLLVGGDGQVHVPHVLVQRGHLLDHLRVTGRLLRRADGGLLREKGTLTFQIYPGQREVVACSIVKVPQRLPALGARGFAHVHVLVTGGAGDDEHLPAVGARGPGRGNGCLAAWTVLLRAWGCGVLSLVKPGQACLGVRVVRVDRQDVFQADVSVLERIDDPAQPQPGLLVPLVQFGDLQQRLARLLWSVRLGGGDSLSQQIGYLCGVGHVVIV